MPIIAVSQFVRRQTPESEFSYYDGNWEDLATMATTYFAQAHPGYRDGVCLIPVPPNNFYTSITQLNEGDEFEGVYLPRQAGETPRKRIWKKNGQKMPAQSCELVLYRHDVLAENHEQSCDTDWEIISINASPQTEGGVPLTVGTLLANHFQDSGGTATHLNPEELVDALRVSYFYWKDKMNCKSVTIFENLHEIICDSRSETLWFTQQELAQLGSRCPICEGTDWSSTGKIKKEKDGKCS